ncbi:UDP-glucose:glyco glucosyltransferase 1 isoform X2 [Pelobates cultripes]|uniref:UDP-glucose ceramide glucosyltransferase-like 1 n=1 Tax=Pelobates cultripes TaxID=61616 RepID=A0AAD1R9X0_PELCU|nr:UDP-glucose:glyco glucosyltransferase 1 isoform X2 [Pelobates cultripes]
MGAAMSTTSSTAAKPNYPEVSVLTSRLLPPLAFTLSRVTTTMLTAPSLIGATGTTLMSQRRFHLNTPIVNPYSSPYTTEAEVLSGRSGMYGGKEPVKEMAHTTLTVTVLCCLFLYCSAITADSKAVTTSLTTKWPSTSLLLEASEYLADEGEDKFWSFVEENLQVDDQGNDNSKYELTLNRASTHLSPLQQSLLKFALSLRSYSATVQTFQQIAADEPPPLGCSAFISVHGVKTCDLDSLPSLLKTATERPKPFLFKGDHRYQSKASDSPVVILYAEIGSKDFSRFHLLLSVKARAGEINYVLRHYVANPGAEKVFLSGYGVELAIKSTEYKAKDDTQVKGNDVNATVVGENDPLDEVQGFLFGKLRQIYPELKEQLKELRKHLVESTNEMSPLKVWELQDLSFQTAARILAAPSSEALLVLKDLSQNFPTKARSLTRTAVDAALRREVEENQKYFKGSLGIQPGDSALFINGLHIDLESQDIFSLFDILRNEARVMEGLHRLGIEGPALHNVLKLNVQPSNSDYAVDIRSPAIIWVNNLEIDSRYNSWPSSVQELLRPTFPGVIRQIRKNFHNFVIIVDPVHESTPELINVAEMFLSNHIPIRLGLVFVVNDSEEVDGLQDAGVALIRAFNYVADEIDNYQAFQTVISIYNKVRAGDKLMVKHVTGVLEEKYPYIEISSILGLDSAYDQFRKEGKEYFLQTGLSPLPVVLFNGMPFPKDQLEPDELETATMHKILETTSFFQKAVYLGEVTNEHDVVDHVMSQPNVVSRINMRILEPERQYLDFTAINNYFVDDYARFSVLDSSAKTAAVANSMNYLTKKDDSFVRPVTFWIVGDFDKPSGRQLLYDAIKHQKSSNNVRIGMINNPSQDPSFETTHIGRAIWAALQTQSSNNAKNFITKIIKEENAKALEAGLDIAELAVGGMDVSLFREAYESPKVDFILSHAAYCRDILKLNKGERAIIGNGRIVGPLIDSEVFNQEDFHLLENLILKTSAQKIKSHIQLLGVEEDLASDLVMRVDSLLSSQPKGEGRTEYQLPEDLHSAVKIRPKEGVTYFEIVAVVDPVTKGAQRLAPLLLVLSQILNMNLRVFMNCQSKLSDMPLKSFYRYVLEPEILFTPEKKLAPGPLAVFLDMPQSPLFTLNLNTPDSWMVESVRSPYDLDNIYLAEVDSVVTGEFELEYLLLEGHCFDVSTGQPPRGLQFTLGTPTNPVVVDTIVMANLGYFQLKAYPGAWVLRLRKGRSEEIYNIYSHEGTDSTPDASEVVVVLHDFRSKIIKLKVQKKPDKLEEDLLSDGTSENESGFWESISWGLTGGQKAEEVKQDKEDVLNIFSLASGHLYERFLRIMMLTVLKNTQTPVKFWFLKNYLSPTFKNFIPYMAKKYNFQYELVQYKWPRWLHQQTEKQRIIWGYKILFLDVLFPLAVDKIIFVDADQIVRTDLKELRDFNLDGAPYGYTPFCDSRREMDGYRFWRSGYWASHLAGRKYHISALYVVDLKKFRKIAAGDRLRGQYQGLSQDPNSLSNLDQDLPNNMIHQVPIKSLPQEWLWCETWCDEATKKRAKTIDLCNNPMTKEPKLEAAVRIVPEWQDYDQEIKKLYSQFQGSTTDIPVDGSDSWAQQDTQDPKSHLEL